MEGVLTTSRRTGARLIPAPYPSCEFVLTDRDFQSLRRLVREITGIALTDAKRPLVYGRLARRLRALKLDSFAAYRELLAGPAGAAEIGEFTNAITTNLTSFFRESRHFDYLREEFLLPRRHDAAASRRIRIWCAAASTGEEPYSIAMTVAEALPEWEKWDIRILATDIDTSVIARGQQGIYREERLAVLPRARVVRFFDACGAGQYRVKPALAKMIAFRQLNLAREFPMRGPLDAIFCRNVTIYFDKETQRDLFRRLAPLQRPGDLLFLGHSESLSEVSDDWELIGRTVYRRGHR